MASSGYDFYHECDAMPSGVTFLKLKGSSNSQFTAEKRDGGVSLHMTVLYGFKHCPYCGEKMM